MACDKFRMPCDKCAFAGCQDKCPGVNFWNEFCDRPKVDEDKILKEPIKKTFGKLFRSLQKFLPEVNFQSLSSNKVSTLKKTEIIMLLKAVRLKDKELVPPDYVNLTNENIGKMLYKVMIAIHENRE